MFSRGSNVLNVTGSLDNVAHITHLELAAPGFIVITAHGANDLWQGSTVIGQPGRINCHLVLLLKAAEQATSLTPFTVCRANFTYQS